jgi:hypothetical protein
MGERGRAVPERGGSPAHSNTHLTGALACINLFFVVR